MRDRLKELILPLALISSVALLIGLVVYATQASAEPATSTEYAEYRNDRWHFSLAVPAGMTVQTYDHPSGAQTMQFLDASGDYEFEVSAAPYSQLDLTLDRIGEPSDTSDQPNHLEIVNVQRDDLVKVWFTKNGTLYVVVALADQENWLTDILTTWQFTD